MSNTNEYRNEYRAEILDILLKTMGEGFPKTLFPNNKKERGENTNNFKQKVSRMKTGDEEALFYVNKKINETMWNFYSSEELDDSEKSNSFCEHKGSDKYFIFAVDIWNAFSGQITTLLDSGKYKNMECSKEDFIAEIISDSLSSTIAKITDDNYLKNYVQTNQKLMFQIETKDEKIQKENEEYKKWKERAFRKEYYTSFKDVLKNKKNNKTFYKWPLDVFKKEAKTKFDSIITSTLGEGESNIEKMKYEPGLRKWTTFEKLFENEQNNKGLKEVLENNKLLAEYQIFQSRMLTAYFFENLRAILPNYINTNNTEKLFDSIEKLIQKFDEFESPSQGDTL